MSGSAKMRRRDVKSSAKKAGGATRKSSIGFVSRRKNGEEITTVW